MPKEKAYPSLSEIYRRAWESCMALWPLFLVRLVFVVVNFGAILLCLFLTCWPFLRSIWADFRQTENGSFQSFLQEKDFSNLIPDPRWILMAAGMFLLLIAWWSLLEALFDGAVYARLRNHQENGGAFSLSEFFKNGIRYMGPMIGLQMAWFLIMIGILFSLFALTLLLGLFFKVLSIPWWIGILLALPAGFAAIVLFIGMAGFAVMGGAYLMEDKGVMSALQRSFQKCKEGYGRAVGGIFLVWVLYFVFSVAFQAVMAIFEKIPWIGIFFFAFEMLVSVGLSIVIWVFMPSLAVAFSLEKES